MDISLECLTCVLNQAINASKLSTKDEDIQKTIIKDVLLGLSTFENYRHGPELFKIVQDIIQKHTGNSDPYKSTKDQHIKTALDVYPMLVDFLNQKKNKLYWSLITAAAGNIIDSGIYSEIDIFKIIKHELHKKFSFSDFPKFKNAIKNANTLLIIADNAGETVFDRILIETLSGLKITYAVRNAPILNDATTNDAHASMIIGVEKIISSGSSIPGTIIKDCSHEFKKIFYESDVVISKGLGNYETLPRYEREIFYILKAKCPRISNAFSVGLGDYVLKSSITP